MTEILVGELKDIDLKQLILGLLMQRCPFCYQAFDIPISCEQLQITCKKCKWSLTLKKRK